MNGLTLNMDHILNRVEHLARKTERQAAYIKQLEAKAEEFEERLDIARSHVRVLKEDLETARLEKLSAEMVMAYLDNG